MKARIIAGAWLMIVIAGVAAPTTSGAATIHGHIKTNHGKPIRRVVVTLEKHVGAGSSLDLKSTTSDDEGRFRFEDVEPGSYQVTTEKNAWVGVKRFVTVRKVPIEQEIELPIVMEMTLLYHVLANVQAGSVTYVVIFGILVLVANYFIAPRPSNGVTVCGWCVVLASIAIGCVKLEAVQSVTLSVLGVGVALLVQRIGGKVASRRIQGEEEQARVEEAAREQEQENIKSLVGKVGVALTDLKAYGSVDIDGNIVSVRALRGYISQDTRVVVKMIDGVTPVVERYESVAQAQ